MRRPGLLALLAGALLFTTPAHATGVEEAIALALEYIGVAASYAVPIAQGLVVSAVSTGLSYVARAIASATTTGKQPAGVSGFIQVGGTLPRGFIVGEFATSGSLVYAGTWGQDGKVPNAYLTYVIALSDLPMTALTQMWVGSSRVTLSALRPAPQGYAVPEFYTGGQDYLWVTAYDGTQTMPDPFLIQTFGSDPNYPWTSAMVAPGTAYVIVTARLNTSLFSGFPQYKFAGQGAKLYDPRLDTTAGGSGSQRFATPSTWAWSNNPKVIEYNILMGISDSGGWLWGPQGMSQARLPFAAWASAMNECDALIGDGLGNTVNQHRAGLEISVDMQPVDVIDALNMACNGKTAEIGGVYKPIAGAAGTSVFSFSDASVIISAPNTASPFPSQTSVINTIQGNYPEPLQGWAMTAAPSRNLAAAVTADGKVLPANVNYAVVPYANQVQRLMVAALNEARKFRTHTIVLPPPAWVLEPTDAISWTSTINGYTAKLFTVKSVMVLPNCDVQVGIAEVDPADYNFNPATDYLVHVPVPIPLALPPILDLPSDDNAALLRRALSALDQLGEALIHQSYTLGGEAIAANRALAYARVELTQAISNGLSAEARARIDVAASFGAVTASGLFQIVAVATAAGADASLSMQVSASAGGTYADAGIFLDAVTGGGSRIRLVAGQIELDGTVMTGGGVTGAMLAAGAATGTFSATANSILSIADNNWHSLFTTSSVGVNGGLVQVDITVDWDSSATSNKFLKFQLLRDGSAIASWPRLTGHGFQVGGNQADAKSFMFDDTGATAGSHVWDFQYQWIGPNNNQVTFDGGLRGTEIRK